MADYQITIDERKSKSEPERRRTMIKESAAENVPLRKSFFLAFTVFGGRRNDGPAWSYTAKRPSAFAVFEAQAVSLSSAVLSLSQEKEKELHRRRLRSVKAKLRKMRSDHGEASYISKAASTFQRRASYRCFAAAATKKLYRNEKPAVRIHDGLIFY